ncbi:ABC transporter substrate-binding protein [Catalinimonas alkaloidigena]|nr:ABC transporter substrate-binding protein [Catalinimonas alkaloidigena]
MSFLWVVVTGCWDRSATQPVAEISGDTVLPAALQVKYARGFHFSKQEAYTLLHLHPGEDTLTLVLVPRDQSGSIALVESPRILVPVQKLVALSTTHVALLHALGADSVLSGLMRLQDVYEPTIRKRAAAGKVVEVGVAYEPNQEVILGLSPDVVMVSGGASGENRRLEIVQEAGIAVLPNTEWLEPHPLGRAEWLKVMGALLGQEHKAAQEFERIATAYETQAALVDRVDSRPTVVVNLPYKDTWFVPGGQNYQTQLLHDAGADYPWHDAGQQQSLPLSFEAVYPIALEAEVWLNTGTATTRTAIREQDARYADFRPMQTGRVYNNTRQMDAEGRNPYWERGVIEPHVLLADLIKILHPELLPDHQLQYYQQLP